MATESKAPASVPDSPQLAHYKAREKELSAKIDDMKGRKAEPGFDYTAAVARNESLLASVRKEIKALQK